ncbi:hypothetical protein FXN63_23695 [Pigmentiphaga aceris]|uniref:Uncharacterized protein n=1 Tax=Pigmentiphaga aceris TaxID=1940612 RepID=A0A5C0B3K4_9BURK|nr:hypothetical protein [Pigmentiphaga aceris]QEI08504.1 hypothetical protein FXN63_23695 [Pigmentiphaga aceris]
MRIAAAQAGFCSFSKPDASSNRQEEAPLADKHGAQILPWQDYQSDTPQQQTITSAPARQSRSRALQSTRELVGEHPAFLRFSGSDTDISVALRQHSADGIKPKYGRRYSCAG